MMISHERQLEFANSNFVSFLEKISVGANKNTHELLQKILHDKQVGLQ